MCTAAAHTHASSIPWEVSEGKQTRLLASRRTREEGCLAVTVGMRPTTCPVELFVRCGRFCVALIAYLLAGDIVVKNAVAAFTRSVWHAVSTRRGAGSSHLIGTVGPYSPFVLWHTLVRQVKCCGFHL